MFSFRRAALAAIVAVAVAAGVQTAAADGPGIMAREGGEGTVIPDTTTLIPTTAAPANTTADPNPSCKVKDCVRCSPYSGDICEQCRSDKFLTDKGVCEQKCRVYHCSICMASNNTYCARCNSGYAISDAGLCVTQSGVSGAAGTVAAVAVISTLAAAVSVL